jgi:magnesium chelatase subunit D
VTAALSLSSTWSDPVWVATLLALDPTGLHGVHICGPSGPERDAWLALLRDLIAQEAPFRRCPAQVDEERLLGGLDLAASLATGSAVLQRGLLAEADNGFVIFPMAECLPSNLGAQIATALDTGLVRIARDGIDSDQVTKFGVVLLDEGASDDERAPDALVERCALRLETNALRAMLESADAPNRAIISAARSRLDIMEDCPDDVLTALCETAFAFGINSFRPVMAAIKATQAIAALEGRLCATMQDAALASRLVLTHRATRLPAPEETEHQDETQEDGDQGGQQSAPPPNASSEDAANSPTPSDVDTTEMMIDIVKAAIPDSVMAALQTGGLAKKLRNRDGRGSGDSFTSPKRGRPVGSRRGSLRSGQRLHLIDTLRAAAPWQKMRQDQSITRRVHVRTDDIRIRRFVEKRETTIVFAVDASGSTAWQRLAEAKGAVQLMLAHAYQSRARVALVAFRKEGAEVVLPPTRSLARARRLLSDMVGGGGTPLAHGLETAMMLALSERAKGRTPRLLILTDGRGNIARDGSASRSQAETDAFSVAMQIRAFGLTAIHIDTSPRPRPGAQQLAAKMGGLYAPLPSPRSGDMARLAGL